MENNKPVIEKNIPMPVRGIGSQWDFLLEMEVGDSVFIEGDRKSFHGRTKWVRKRQPERRWITSIVEGGYRIWRSK